MSNTRLYVGNIAPDTTESDLQDAFRQSGVALQELQLVGQSSGRHRGFAFAELPSEEDAQKAIEELDGTTLGSRPLKVRLATPKRDLHGGFGRSDHPIGFRESTARPRRGRGGRR